LLLGLLFSAGSVLAATDGESFRGETPSAWLWKMNEAFIKLNYNGVFSYHNGSDLSTLRVIHAVVDGVQRERLVHLNGAEREIIRIGDEVKCILQPGDELLKLEDSIPSGPFARAFTRSFDQLSSHYRLRFHGEGRVAGRNAVRLTISAPERDRYGYRLWLDSATGFLLASELVDERGKRLESFQFSEIGINVSISEAQLNPQQPQGSVISHLSLEKPKTAPANSESEMVPWRAGWTPVGFRMSASDLRRSADSRRTLSTLMYTDGLAAFSVFIEDMPKRGAGNVVTREGATVVVTVKVRGPDSSQLVTVVGEIPIRTAQRIAQSVAYDRSQK